VVADGFVVADVPMTGADSGLVLAGDVVAAVTGTGTIGGSPVCARAGRQSALASPTQSAHAGIIQLRDR
jgi:hypothetical protein